MRTCLDGLVGEFTSRRIPAQAVIHEPTKKNSRQNWHFHLQYYAGEAEQLPGGRWSFEREHQRDKWGTMKWVPLKRMGRNDEVAAEDWVPRLKERWSEIVNAQAIAEGIATRFTNLRNDQRGRPKAQTRYTPGRQALHKQGFYSDADIELNIGSWREWRKRKRAQLRRMTHDVKQGFDRLLRDPRRTLIDGQERQHVDRQMDRFEMALDDVEKYADHAVHAAMLRHMMMSGPKDAIAHYSNVDAALETKPPTAVRSAKRSFAAEVCTAAKTHLSDIEPTLARLAEIERVAFKTMQEAHSALQEYIPKLESRMDAAVAEPAPKPIDLGPAAITRIRAMPSRSRQALAAHLASGRGIAG